MRRQDSRTGLTLVELLVASALMAMVAGVCMAVLTGGIHVWQRAVDYGTRDQASLVAFERMRRDLQNVRRFTLIESDGRFDQYAFAAVERADPDGPEELGRLVYFVDVQERVLCRAFVPYRLARRSRLREHCQPVLEDVTRLRLTYFGFDEAHNELRWRQSWRSADPPAAVKVSIVRGEDRSRPNTHSFVVSLMRVPVDVES